MTAIPQKKRAIAAATKQTARLGTAPPRPETSDHIQITNYTAVDRKYNELEKLHEKTNVTLKLPRGRRLKLDSPEELRRKRRTFQGFNIKFADLNDKHPQTDEAEYVRSDTDDDDLPESHDILKTVSAVKACTPSETNYSDSDLDSLIRAVPLDDKEQASVAKITSTQDDKQKPRQQPRYLVGHSPTLPPTLKRDRENSPPRERRKKLPKTTAPVDHELPIRVRSKCPTYQLIDLNISSAFSRITYT